MLNVIVRFRDASPCDKSMSGPALISGFVTWMPSLAAQFVTVTVNVHCVSSQRTFLPKKLST